MKKKMDNREKAYRAVEKFRRVHDVALCLLPEGYLEALRDGLIHLLADVNRAIEVPKASKRRIER